MPFAIAAVSVAGLGVALIPVLLLQQARSRRELSELRLRMTESEDRVLKAMRDEQALVRREIQSEARGGREESARTGERLRDAVEKKLGELTKDNGSRLEEMRRTVEEKLEGTLERRLGQSFKIVSERLELVHKGLGEMQSLAVGVGDLKRVLTNVKTRGTWGEIQLGGLLSQLLSPEQFAQNVEVRAGSGMRVEFAVKLPGPGDGLPNIWLPLDAKFPLDTYEKVVHAQDSGDPAAVEAETVRLEQFIKNAARDISSKYVSPPETTDFAIMYLPTEGLFAEVVRRDGLAEVLQRDYRVMVAGPTTLTSLLNSLQLGFRTLAIQKRSSEVWEVLGAVKTEFGKFGDVLRKVEKKLQEAGNVIEAASQRTRVITRKLKNVQELPAGEAEKLLGASRIDTSASLGLADGLGLGPDDEDDDGDGAEV